MGLVDDNGVGEFLHAGEFVRSVADSAQIGVVENCQIAVRPAGAAGVRQHPLESRLPDRLHRHLGREQRHTLALVDGKPLDEHEADVRLAQADSVSQERSAVGARDL